MHSLQAPSRLLAAGMTEVVCSFVDAVLSSKCHDTALLLPVVTHIDTCSMLVPAAPAWHLMGRSRLRPLLLLTKICAGTTAVARALKTLGSIPEGSLQAPCIRLS